MDGQDGLLLDRLQGYEAHRRPSDRFADGSGVVGVVLSTLSIRFDELGRHDLRNMTELEQLTRPVLRSGAGLESTSNLAHQMPSE